MNMKKAVVLLLTSLLLVAAQACSTYVARTEPVSPPPSRMAPKPCPPLELIDARILFLEEALRGQRLSGKDREMALNLLDAYRTLRRACSPGATEGDRQVSLHALFQVLVLLDEEYFKRIRSGMEEHALSVRLFQEKSNEILEDYIAGDYKEVIRHGTELKKSFGPEALAREVGLVFALSLAREGKLKEALEMGERIARDMDSEPDLLYLKAKIVEWQLALDQREKAVYQYEKLTDDLDEREGLARQLQEKIRARGKPDIVVEDIDSESPRYTSIQALLEEVDTLVKRKAFGKAKLLLVRHRTVLKKPHEREVIDRTLKEVDLAQEQYEREKLSVDSGGGSVRLSSVRELIDQEKYEEAIHELETLERSGLRSSAEENLKKEAIEKFINSERNRAAKLFLAAQRTQDPAQKKKYLLSSRNILKSIVDKYPFSPLIDRINSHINQIDKALRRMGETPGVSP